MSSNVIDIESLLIPIAGDNPAGENLRYAGLHDEIRKERHADDDMEQGEWKREPRRADWRRVYEITTEALAFKTKDLQVAAWLVEASCNLHGLPGLRDGCHLMRELQERFWDHLYPEIDEGDLDARVQTLEWFDRQLATQLKEVSIAKPQAEVAYLYRDLDDYYHKIKMLNRIGYAEEREQAREELEQWNNNWLNAKAASPLSFYTALNASLSQCEEARLALDRVIDELFGKQAPGMMALKKILEELQTMVETAITLKGGAAEGVKGLGAAGANQQAAPAGLTGLPLEAKVTGPIRTRPEALQQLSAVAEYFRQAEPHSPISYLVQRAIKWGQMPLDAWLQDVIKNVDVLEQLRETLGLRSNADIGSTRDEGSIE